MQWTYRVIHEDLGAHVLASSALFEDTVVTTPVAPVVDVYAGTKGNIAYEKDLTEPYFAIYSGQFQLSREKAIRLRIDTRADLFLTIDGDVVAASSGSAGNQTTSASVRLDAGTHVIEVGIYQQSGLCRYRIWGDLASQVDKVLSAPDRTPPAAPNTPVLTLVPEPPYISLNIAVSSAAYEADRAGYRVYIAKNTSATPPATSTFVTLATLHELEPDAGASFLQPALELGAWYHVFAVAFDALGNLSPASSIASVQAADTVRPGSVSAIYVDGVLHTGTPATPTYLVEEPSVTFTWTDPGDSDLAYVNIYMKEPTSPAGAAWDGSVLIAKVPAGVERFIYVHGVGEVVSTGVLRQIFFQTEDAYGNPDYDHPTADSTYPPGVKLSITRLLPEGDTVVLSPASGYEPNERGWHKSNPRYTAAYIGPDTAQLYYFNWPPDDGAAFVSQLSADKDIDDETGIEGELLSCFVATNADLYSGVGTVRVYVDKTAPTACSSISVGRTETGLLLTWTDGTDSNSGLLHVEVWRAEESTTFGDAELIATIAAGVERYLDTALEADVKYAYWLRPVDRADNVGSEAGGVTATVSTAGAASYLNWIDNSSFERGVPDSTLGWIPERWTVSALTSSDWNTARPPTGFHGARYPTVSSTKLLKQDGIPLLGTSFYLSFWARRHTSGDTPAPKVFLRFKDISGTVVSSIAYTYYAVADSDTWERATLRSTGAFPVFGPASPAPITYPSTARTVEVQLYTDGDALDVDGVLLQEVYTDDSGSSWKSKELGETAPSDWVDSRIFNSDRVNAWLARFGELYANIITAGVLQDASGLTQFDLDNARITLDTDGTLSGSEVVMDDTGIRTTMRSYAFGAMNGTIGADEDLQVSSLPSTESGDILLLQQHSDPNILGFLVVLAVTYHASFDDSPNEDIVYSVAIEQKSSSTKPGHGAWYLYTEKDATTGYNVYLNYSVYHNRPTVYSVLTMNAAWISVVVTTKELLPGP